MIRRRTALPLSPVPGAPGYLDLTAANAYNPDRARALLKEAGISTPLSMLAGWRRQWPGKAGSTAATWPLRFIRRGCRFGGIGN